MNNLDNVIKECNLMVKEIETIKKEMTKKVQATFSNAIDTFFEEVPEIGAIVWDQYTPYFSDGDECIFSVHDKWAIPAHSFEDPDFYLERYPEDQSINLGVDASWIDNQELAYPRNKASPITIAKELVAAATKLNASVERTIEATRLTSEFLDALSGIPEEVYKDMFGDHCTIIVRKGKIEVEECSHD